MSAQKKSGLTDKGKVILTFTEEAAAGESLAYIARALKELSEAAPALSKNPGTPYAHIDWRVASTGHSASIRADSYVSEALKEIEREIFDYVIPRAKELAEADRKRALTLLGVPQS